MVRKLLCVTCVLLIQGCSAFWPYKNDFDCDTQNYENCQSLYVVSQKADHGVYAPKYNLK